MTDIVERLRSIDISWSDEGEIAADAAAVIESLQKQLADECEIHHGNEQVLQRERDTALKIAEQHSDVVNNMIQQLSEEHEAHLIAEQRWIEEMAEAQAREKVLHRLSNELLRQIDINDFMDSHGHSAQMLKAFHDLMKYNTQPADDSALKALLVAERERCASVCLDVVDGQQYAEAIRALGD